MGIKFTIIISHSHKNLNQITRFHKSSKLLIITVLRDKPLYYIPTIQTRKFTSREII